MVFMNKKRIQQLAGLLKEEDFDLSDNPLVGEPATEAAYCQFKGTGEWIDWFGDAHRNLNFGDRYKKYVFKDWDEWHSFINNNDLTIEQNINITAWEVTPPLNGDPNRETEARKAFHKYWILNNRAPFILMIRK